MSTVCSQGPAIEDRATGAIRFNDARVGSERLAMAANGAIAAYAKRKRIKRHEAQWLLLNSDGCVN